MADDMEENSTNAVSDLFSKMGVAISSECDPSIPSPIPNQNLTSETVAPSGVFQEEGITIDNTTLKAATSNVVTNILQALQTIKNVSEESSSNVEIPLNDMQRISGQAIGEGLNICVTNVDLLEGEVEGGISKPGSEPMELEAHEIQEANLDANNTEENHDDSSYCWNYEVKLETSAACVAETPKTEFPNGNYMRGCKWAPDGSCLLTNSNDSFMRIFNLPVSFYGGQDWKSFDSKDEDWSSALKIKEGGLVYDYCWYPLMSSADPVSSCFLTTASNAPVHLWDAFTGNLRCSYLAYNQVDEVTAAHSVAFDRTGDKIYCGFDKCVRIFNIARPGREYTERKLKNKDFPTLNQSGIISCIDVSPSMPALYACGSFRNTIGLYLEDGTVLCVLEGHLGGLTQLKFSQDGTKLFSGGRKDSRLICWDIRNLGDEYEILERQVTTNQRIYFDLTTNDRYVISGGTDGNVLIWDMHSNTVENKRIPINKFGASTDCVNGVSINPMIPILATASGQRHFKVIADDSDDELFVEPPDESECGVRLWKIL